MINKKILLILLSFVFILFPGSPSRAEILVTENFDDWDDYLYGDPNHTTPLPWIPRHGTDVWSHTADGATHSPLEINAPGRGGSGKSLKIYRNGTVWTGNPYFPSYDLNYANVPQLANNITSLYMRWYMRVPVEYSFPEGQKLFRFNFSDGQMPFNINYGGTLQAYSVSSGGDAPWVTLARTADWKDGEWHAHQVYIDLPTRTITYWLDGVQTFHATDYYGLAPAARFGNGAQFIQHFPYGNSFSNDTHQEGWQFFEIDDVVIATTKAPTDPIEGGPIASVPDSQPSTEPESTTVSGIPTKGSLLLTETFQDNNWSSRGWYDGTDSTGVTSGGYSGNALRWNWMIGERRPAGFSTIRRILAEPVDEFILEYYVKYDSGWRGSGLAYHPHTLHMVSSEDTIYQGGANSNSALYFSQVSGTSAPYAIQPRFGHQDSMRVNTSFGIPTNNLTSTTEDRSANLCNTPLAATGADYGDCYSMGGGAYYSFSGWRSPSVVVPTDQWVKLTYYVKANSVTNGTANFDGIVKVWVNEDLAINNESALLVAGGYGGATWDKFMMAPYIGNGSPVNQTMWLDEMRVWSVAEGSSSIVQPPPLLRIQ